MNWMRPLFKYVASWDSDDDDDDGFGLVFLFLVLNRNAMSYNAFMEFVYLIKTKIISHIIIIIIIIAAAVCFFF